jgi:hypothetical protein
MTVTGNIAGVVNVSQTGGSAFISDTNDGVSATLLTGMSTTITPLSAASVFVVMAQGNMEYKVAAQGESSAWVTYEVSGGSETILK